MTTAAGGHRRQHHRQETLSHLLEVTIISSQDLHRATRSMRTYAVAYINPNHALYTRIDPAGRTNPSWNDKFFFRIDDAFLRSYTSSISVDIYASRRCSSSDALLGTARIILSTFLRPSSTAFIALQVRRPRSLRPQGILNVSIALVDPNTKSAAAIYASAVRAVAFAHKDLMRPVAGGEDTRLEKCGSLGVGEKEMKMLNSKLEMWRKELPATAPPAGGRRRRRRRRGILSCFCRGRVRED